MDDHDFQQDKFLKNFRETQGIYFDFNIRPTSPKKNKDKVVLPFSKDPLVDD